MVSKASCKSVFVTVGTTQFSALTNIVSSDKFLDVLKQAGYSNITIQHGSAVMPSPPAHKVSVSSYDYKNSLAEDFSRADLIITHGGAGSIMEGLTRVRESCGKVKMLVVVNADLMDNHQTEIADKLERDGHILYATLGENSLNNSDRQSEEQSQLIEVMEKVEMFEPKIYEKPQPLVFANFVDKLMDV